jgi:rhamnosyltransferase
MATAGAPNSAHQVFAIVVAFDPDPSALRRLLSTLAPQVGHTVLVDNSDRPDARAAIETAAAATPADVELIRIGANSGIAHAQNVGAARAVDLGARYLLLSDDDSVPGADMVERLLGGFRRAAVTAATAASPGRVAAVGPRVFDAREPASTLVFRDTLLGPRRAALAPGETRPLPVAFLVASGCLIDVAAWHEIGPMREDLFIDHVDLEWGVRARREGWSLFAVGDALLEHRLGDKVLRPWFLGRRRIHVHSPARNYYLARNTLALVRGDLFTAGWRLGYLIWLARYVAFNALFVAPRARRARMFARALRDALTGRSGPLPP